MKYSTKKKFISLLIIVLVFSMFSPAVFAAKKTTTAYTLKSITGGGKVTNTVDDVSIYTLGFNVRKIKADGNIWAVNLTFIDPKNDTNPENDVKIKINRRDVSLSILPTPLDRSNFVISFEADAKVKLGTADPVNKRITVTIRVTDKTSTVVDSIAISGVTAITTDYPTSELTNGNIVAHFKKTKS